MSKILVIANETSHTDSAVTDLASNNSRINHGLISDAKFIPINNGYYHTTVVDLSPGEITNLAKHFDTVMLLDQDPDSYPHFKSLVTTVRLMCDLELAGINTVYKETLAAKRLLYWRNFLKENKSFCFYPFAALINDKKFAHICEKNHVPVAKITDLNDWKNNTEFNNIRNKMIEGTLLPRYCGDCYLREEQGQESMRQFETLEWANRIGADTVDDFINIKKPLYYEIRPTNTCNIMCRTCDDQHSHLIEKEWKQIGIPLICVDPYQNTQFDLIDFDSMKVVYVGGGEPTVIPEFYDFLRKCISLGRTDFELNIGTNGLKFSNTLIELLDHFSNVCLSISFDGYKKINDYVRWGSNFDTIVDNTRILREHGHKIGLQTVFSMYNLTRIHEIFEFYDREFPGCSSLVNYAGGLGNKIVPNNHPRPDLVVESMKKCQQTRVYYSNGRSIKSMVDLTLNYYSNPDYVVNVDHLKEFYEFNSKLDQARGSKLVDYIPELDAGCKLYLPNDL
jgi:sulfatase maturation enzyme AslB (radical SAM superfamily)